MKNSKSYIGLYNFIKIFEVIIEEVVFKVLSMKCLSDPKDRFVWDYVNDVGVINILRLEYLKTKEIGRVYKYYQSSRLEESSPRYESLIATMLITIVGSVISGIILLHYEDLKDNIRKWIETKNRKYNIQGDQIDEAFILKEIIKKKDEMNDLKKFFSIEADELKNDFDKLINCYIANKMLCKQLISYKEYYEVVCQNMKRKKIRTYGLENKFVKYKENYLKTDDSINVEKIFMAIDGYSRGLIGIRLNDESYFTSLKKPVKGKIIYEGIAASIGFGSGIAYIKKEKNNIPKEKYILLIDPNRFSQGDIDLIAQSEAVITNDCGITGHIPVVCRGMGKACVILDRKDILNISEGTSVTVSGGQGMIALI